jgi:hypothetical protein
MGKLPQTLEEIDVSSNNLSFIYEFPVSLKEVLLNNNKEL